MNKNILVAVITLFVLIGGFFLLKEDRDIESNNDNMNTEEITSIERGEESPIINPPENVSPTQKTTAVTNNQSITMESKSFSFNPNIIRAKVGEKVSIQITSQGNHNFVIDEFGVKVATPSGKTTEVVFTPTKAGTFEYYCGYSGHRQAGQVGKLIVE